MKQKRPFAWMMAIAIASITMTACSLDGYEPEKPFVTCPAPKTMLFACSFTQPEIHAGVDVLFNEDDIEWFNVTTREIKFREMEEPLYKRLEPFHEIYFYLGYDALFVVSSFVADWDSRVYTDLVLHYDVITDPGHGHYYLHDCYPSQFIDTDEVKANIKKNAGQWELFIYYLESKGKLRH